MTYITRSPRNGAFVTGRWCLHSLTFDACTDQQRTIQFNSIQFYCKIGMTERSQ